MKIGNTTFDLQGLKDMTKQEFIKAYAGKLDYDISEAWKLISKAVKKMK